MRQREIWLVNYDPSVGHEFKKSRPAIIIVSDAIINVSDLITVMPITSNLNNKVSDDIVIKKDSQNNLFSDSVIKVGHINSFDRVRFIKRIGVISEQYFMSIKKYLKSHFKL